MILAHRGGVANTNLQENTLQAFKRAMSLKNDGTDGIECDLRIIKTGEIVIYHDSKTKNGKPIKLLNLNEIHEMGMCTLTELMNLAHLKRYNGILNLEIKEYNLSTTVHTILQNFKNLHKFIILTSFLHCEIKEISRIFSKNVNCVRFGLLYKCLPMTLKNTLENTNYYIALSHFIIPDIDTIRTSNTAASIYNILKKYNSRIIVYTVNDQTLIKRLVADGISVVSDFIE